MRPQDDCRTSVSVYLSLSLLLGSHTSTCWLGRGALDLMGPLKPALPVRASFVQPARNCVYCPRFCFFVAFCTFGFLPHPLSARASRWLPCSCHLLTFISNSGEPYSKSKFLVNHSLIFCARFWATLRDYESSLLFFGCSTFLRSCLKQELRSGFEKAHVPMFSLSEPRVPPVAAGRQAIPAQCIYV